MFQEQVGRFKDYALSRSPKTVVGNRAVDGAFLADFLERIVDLLSRDEPVFLSEICNGLQQEGSNYSVGYPVDPMGGAPPSRAAASAAQPSVLEPKREHMIPLQASRPALPVLAKVAPSTAQPGAMEKPMCLIENSLDGELQLNQAALALLQSVRQPVVVVAIAGLYRTGKSYLMNRLAGKDQGGFSLGSTIQSHTKGIWMWCLPHPHPCRAGHTLVLLDTEGLGDVEKGDTKNDTWIFALAVLLSGTLVYNSLGTIDQHALEQLHYVTELTERIKVKVAGEGGRQEGEDSAEFVRFFPAFVWAVRDFTLQLQLDGREITEDEYLENALKLKPGNSQRAQLYNLPRECIRQFFPARKCFVFIQPASRRDLARLEELQEAELEPEFREQVARFCHHIWEKSKPKTIPGGHVVTGAMLGNLAVTYVDAIRSGAVPCMESAVLALAQIENSAAVGEAVAAYEEQLGRRVALPMESVQELLELHAQCEREALRAFMARAFKDDDRRFQGELMHHLEEQKQELCRRNELASLDRCRAALLELSDELEDRICQGVYSVPGSYQRFLDDRQCMVERYWQVPGKGVKAEEVLQEFLQSKEAVAQSILQTDEALTEKEKEMAAQQARAEAAEREQQILKQKEAELQQKLEDRERSYQENLRQLETKLEDERKKLLEEQGKMMDQKLKEQAALLREGFREEAGRLEDQIRHLQQQNEEIRKPSWIQSALGVLTDVATLMLPGFIGRAAGVVTNFIRRLF
ncbi:guanylate-binding protein 1-like isoform X4 [Chelonoidis abingdonii]